MNAYDRTISVPDGRQLEVREAGRLDGFPIFVHHGSPGARCLYQPWVEDAQSRGIRLISYNRPGYGGSTSDPGRSVASAAQDVAAIAEHFGLDQLSVLGGSGGGPHALACAALLPDLVVAAASIASPAPYQADGLDWFAGMGDGNLAEFGAALSGRDALETMIEEQAPGLLTIDPKGIVAAFQALLSPEDAEVMKEDFASYLIDQIHEGISDQRDGWVDDDLAFIQPSWGFQLEQIRIPVLLLHGGQDRFVPFSHGEWLASKLSSADIRLTANDGHLTLAANGIPAVHAWLLDKMQ